MEGCCVDQGDEGGNGNGEELRERGQSDEGGGLGPRAYEYESPGHGIMLQAKLMDEEGKHASNDDGGDELSETEEVEGERWVGGGLSRGASRAGRIDGSDGDWPHPHGGEGDEW